MYPQDTYARHLVSYRGYPLWTPELKDPLPKDYQDHGLKIGDLGYVCPEGRFEVLFNICLPLDHDLHRAKPLPRNFQPITLHDADIATYLDEEDAGSVISTSSLKASPIGQPSDVRFTLSSSGGTLLVLPNGADRYSLRNDWSFGEYAKQHAVEWYRFVEEDLERAVSHDSLYLITGFYKARSVVLASFQGAEVFGDIPAQFRVTQSEGGGTANQAVYISGFKIAIRDEQSSKNRVSAEADDPSVQWPHEYFTTTVDSGEPKPFHPSDVVNRYLLRKDPSATVAITHDSQWATLLKTGRLKTYELAEERLVVEALTETYIVTSQDGSVFLQSATSASHLCNPDSLNPESRHCTNATGWVPHDQSGTSCTSVFSAAEHHSLVTFNLQDHHFVVPDNFFFPSQGSDTIDTENMSLSLHVPDGKRPPLPWDIGSKKARIDDSIDAHSPSAEKVVPEPKWPRGSRRACTFCRRLKMKCVGAEQGPPCNRCLANNHECIFEISIRRKGGPPRNRDLLASSLRKMERTLDEILKSIPNPGMPSGMISRSPSPAGVLLQPPTPPSQQNDPAQSTILSPFSSTLPSFPGSTDVTGTLVPQDQYQTSNILNFSFLSQGTNTIGTEGTTFFPSGPDGMRPSSLDDTSREKARIDGSTEGFSPSDEPKPKWSRGSRACTVCRRLKMQCIGAEQGPPCKRCLTSNHECIFEVSREGGPLRKHDHLTSLRGMEHTLDEVVGDPGIFGMISRSPSPVAQSEALLQSPSLFPQNDPAQYATDSPSSSLTLPSLPGSPLNPFTTPLTASQLETDAYSDRRLGVFGDDDSRPGLMSILPNESQNSVAKEDD